MDGPGHWRKCLRAILQCDHAFKNYFVEWSDGSFRNGKISTRYKMCCIRRGRCYSERCILISRWRRFSVSCHSKICRRSENPKANECKLLLLVLLQEAL